MIMCGDIADKGHTRQEHEPVSATRDLIFYLQTCTIARSDLIWGQ